jgi:hypothetical protein
LFFKSIQMKTLCTASCLFLVACILYSCSKDANVNEGTELQKAKFTFNDTLVFYHFYNRDASNQIMSTRDSVKSLVVIMKVEYAANGKVSKVIFQQNGSNVTFSYEFERNPDGTIRKRQTQPGILDVGDDYNTYTYDNAGHLITDSVFSKGNTSTYHLIAVSTFHYTGNNPTEAEYYEVVSGTPELKTKVKYEYDNAMNPYKKIENNYFYDESGSAIYEISNTGDNNVLKQYSATGNGAFQLTQVYSYQYNSNNYPTKLNSNIVPPGQHPFKIEYFYQ